jgi:hypothetical protein
LANIGDKVDLTERFEFLDCMFMVDRAGFKFLQGLTEGPGAKPQVLPDVILKDVELDPALKHANEVYDRLVAAMHDKERPIREKKLDEIEKELKDLKAKTQKPENLAKLMVANAKEKGRIAGDMMICLLVPAVRKVQGSSDRIGQIHNNLRVAFALAWYQRDQGHYPKELAALTPKYLAQVPEDALSGKALIYRPNDNGYLLYSVGLNGKDEEGRGPDDTPQGDDLSVRIPVRVPAPPK